MFELKVITDFAAAHQLKIVGKKCENLHGHNWKIEVCVAGEKTDEVGILLDFGIIKENVRNIMKRLDHSFLNELNIFKEEYPPSSEHIALYIGKEMEKLLKNINPDVKVSKVTAWESAESAATWFND